MTSELLIPILIFLNALSEYPWANTVLRSKKSNLNNSPSKPSSVLWWTKMPDTPGRQAWLRLSYLSCSLFLFWRGFLCGHFSENLTGIPFSRSKISVFHTDLIDPFQGLPEYPVIFVPVDLGNGLTKLRVKMYKLSHKVCSRKGGWILRFWIIVGLIFLSAIFNPFISYISGCPPYFYQLWFMGQALN